MYSAMTAITALESGTMIRVRITKSFAPSSRADSSRLAGMPRKYDIITIRL